MKAGPIFFVLFFALYLGFEIYAVEKTRYRTEPEFIYLQHIRAMHAVKSCSKDVSQHRQRFMENFDYASTRADDAFAADESPEKVPLSERAADVREEVDQLIDTNGCEHIEIWQLARLYQMLADRSPPIRR